MSLFNRTSKESQRLDKLIDKICKDFNIDKILVLHFISNELERLTNSKNDIEYLKLTELQNKIQINLKTQIELDAEIESKTALIADSEAKIEVLKKNALDKSYLLSNYEKEIAEGQNKLAELNLKIKENNQKKLEIDYDSMMARHAIKEKNDKSFKYFKLFLLLITIAAIVIFTISIFKVTISIVKK